MPSRAIRSERIEARIAPEALALVRRAAAAQGRSLSDFVVTAAEAAAAETLGESREIIRLSPEDSLRLAQMLLNPGPQPPAMKRAFEHRKRLLGER